ncbi:hypothetical protein FBQ97_17025, partial [Acidobacteria bacterium ACD]|nr:hypothetical protein [Acidobacteria bacterium ACD]
MSAPARPALLALVAAVGLWAPLANAGPANADAAVDEELETCLSCHGDESASLDLKSGEKISLYVDRKTLEASVHGTRVRCTQCHPGMDELPHPERPLGSLREYQASFRESCRRCHFENYTKALDGVHEKQHETFVRDGDD